MGKTYKGLFFALLICTVCGMAKKNDWPKTYHLIRIQNSVVIDGPFKVYPDTIEYVGKISIDENGDLSCDCLEDYEDENFKEDIFHWLFDGIKREGLCHEFGRKKRDWFPNCGDEDDPKTAKQFWGDKYFFYEFERQPMDFANEYYMTIDPAIGEKYLKNKWQKEHVKGELLNAILHKDYIWIAPPGTKTPNKYEWTPPPSPVHVIPQEDVDNNVEQF